MIVHELIEHLSNLSREKSGEATVYYQDAYEMELTPIQAVVQRSQYGTDGEPTIIICLVEEA